MLPNRWGANKAANSSAETARLASVSAALAATNGTSAAARAIITGLWSDGAAMAAEAISAGQRAQVAEGVAHDHRVPIFTKQDHLAVAILLHRTISLVVDGAAWLAIAGIFGDETVRIGHRAEIGRAHV